PAAASPRALMHPVLHPWSETFMQLALAELVLLGILGGLVGCWIVHYQLAYSAESLAHALFPGLVVAALLGLPLLLGGVAGAARADRGGDRHRRARARQPARARAARRARGDGAAVREADVTPDGAGRCARDRGLCRRAVPLLLREHRGRRLGGRGDGRRVSR